MNKRLRLLFIFGRRRDRNQGSMEDEHIIPPMDCEEMGKQNCRDASGHARILETCLEKNHKIYEDRVRQDNDKQGKAKGPYEVKLREKELEKEKVQTLMDIKTEKIKQKEKEEEEVRFGPAAQSQSSCGRDGLQSRLRHASRSIKTPAA